MHPAFVVRVLQRSQEHENAAALRTAARAVVTLPRGARNFRLAGIGRLTAGVAHEVKNPINAIVLHLEVLREKLQQVDPDTRRHMDVIGKRYSRDEARNLDANWIFGEDYLGAIQQMLAEGADSAPRNFSSVLSRRRGNRVPVEVHARVLVGDAAGFVDPMTGDGLHLADQAEHGLLETLLEGRGDGVMPGLNVFVRRARGPQEPLHPGREQAADGWRAFPPRHLGAATVMVFTLAVWAPVHAREVAVRRRIEWFVDGVGRAAVVEGVEQGSEPGQAGPHRPGPVAQPLDIRRLRRFQQLVFSMRCVLGRGGDLGCLGRRQLTGAERRLGRGNRPAVGRDERRVVARRQRQVERVIVDARRDPAREAGEGRRDGHDAGGAGRAAAPGLVDDDDGLSELLLQRGVIDPEVQATPAQRIALGVGYLSEDRTGEGLTLGLSVADNITATRLSSCARRWGWLDLGRQAEHAARWTHARRLALALDLLMDPWLDALISGESDFGSLPELMARLLALPEARDPDLATVRSRHWFAWPGAALTAALTHRDWQPRRIPRTGG